MSQEKMEFLKKYSKKFKMPDGTTHLFVGSMQAHMLGDNNLWEKVEDDYLYEWDNSSKRWMALCEVELAGMGRRFEIPLEFIMDQYIASQPKPKKPKPKPRKPNKVNPPEGNLAALLRMGFLAGIRKKQQRRL